MAKARTKKVESLSARRQLVRAQKVEALRAQLAKQAYEIDLEALAERVAADVLVKKALKNRQ